MPKYYRPTTRADALAALAEGGERARPLVGGTDLLVGLRHHTLEPDLLVDLKAVTDLPEPIVVDRRRACRSAPRTPSANSSATPWSRTWYPALVEAALTVGSVAIRNRASLVANSCNASPAADTAPPLLVHGARVTIASLDGDRTRLAGRVLPRPPPDAVRARRARDPDRPAPTRTRVGVGASAGSPGGAGWTSRRSASRPASAPDGGLVLGMGAVGPRPLRAESPVRVDLADDAALEARPRPAGWRSRPRSPTSGAAASTGSRRSASSPRARSSPRRTDGTPGRWRHDHRTRRDHLVDDGLQTVTLNVNGSERTVAVPAHRTLLDGLRDEVGLPGTKSCCAEGECGACTVLLDGKAVNSCLVLCVEAEGHEVTTVEGLSADGLTDLQEEFLNAGAVQCGFCIPGQVVSAEYLLRTNPSPDEPEIREALSGNLCRCAGYQRIVRAVQATAVRRGAAQ